MSDSFPKARFLRPLAALLPLLSVLLLLTLYGALPGSAAALLWIAALLSLAWLLARYRADISGERREARLFASRQARPRASHGEQAPVSLMNIVEGMGDPLILLDMKRRVVHANRAARALLGDSIIGRDIAFSLRHPTALRAIEQSISDRAPREQEITLLDPAERSCLMRVTVIDATNDDDNDGNERISYLVISILDITRIKLAEKMRVDFVANASHELRTPLASIIGFIETLQGPAARDESARGRFLAIMMTEAARMQRLIDDLLSLSKIEMDQHLPPGDSVDLPQILRGLVQTAELRGEGRIRLNLPETLPPAKGDRDQLTQVFQNLLDNAVKYGRPGEPVDITARVIADLPARGGPGLSITVFNPGDAIPAEHLPRLTERFYRVDTARSSKLGGTGLGLAIVKHIVNRHRGTMTIDSTVGAGTTVTVNLPRFKAS